MLATVIITTTTSTNDSGWLIAMVTMNPAEARTSISWFRMLGGPLGTMHRGLFKGALSSVTMERPIQWAGFKWVPFYFNPGRLACWLAGRRKGRSRVTPTSAGGLNQTLGLPSQSTVSRKHGTAPAPQCSRDSACLRCEGRRAGRGLWM